MGADEVLMLTMGADGALMRAVVAAISAYFRASVIGNSPRRREGPGLPVAGFPQVLPIGRLTAFYMAKSLENYPDFAYFPA